MGVATAVTPRPQSIGPRHQVNLPRAPPIVRVKRNNVKWYHLLQNPSPPLFPISSEIFLPEVSIFLFPQVLFPDIHFLRLVGFFLIVNLRRWTAFKLRSSHFRQPWIPLSSQSCRRQFVLVRENHLYGNLGGVGRRGRNSDGMKEGIPRVAGILKEFLTN